MYILLDNFVWMTINTLLAVVPIIAAFFVLKVKRKILKLLIFVIFIAFLPNTLYIVTDLLHFPKQINAVEGVEKLIIIIQYVIFEILGLVTFVLSVNMFEKTISRLRLNKLLVIFLIVLLNFIVGFGIVLGRILRLNSWEVFVNIEKVVNDSFYVMSSDELFMIALVFGFLGNIFYFLLRNYIIRSLNRLYFPLRLVTII